MLTRAQPNVATNGTQFMAEAGALRIEALSKQYGAVAALQGLTLTLGEGEIISVTGPSGAGKSTLARLLSGLEKPDSGRIMLGGQAFSDLPTQARRVAHMFESYALYPTRTVAQNIASPLLAPASLGRWTPAQIRARTDEVLSLTEMSALRERLPSQLSGGQKQRVALCRALVQDPSVYVLDEPIGHLDAKLRHKMRGEIRRRQGALRQSTLWLTPDGIEAMAVADRMVVLVEGTVQQIGTPDDVFARPANVRVARLIGDPAMNVVPVTLSGGAQTRIAVGKCGAMAITQSLFDRLAPQTSDGLLLLGLRPSQLQLQPVDAAAAPSVDRLPVTIYAVEPLGKFTLITAEIGGERLRVKAPANEVWRVGSPAWLLLGHGDPLSFNAATGVLHLA